MAVKWITKMINDRAKEYYNNTLLNLRLRADKLFSYLFIFQWVLAIIIALYVSPLTWKGAESQVHLHLKMAIILGGALSLLPIWVSKILPGSSFSRHFISISQVLYSSMIIHLMGGRIEAHFHVFGSLAFIALYRDWKVLLSATVVVAIDHLLRGYYFPHSVFGIDIYQPWRWLEHAAWVIFEDAFLIYSIRQAIEALKENSQQKADLFNRNEYIENEIIKRTEELNTAQMQLVESAKLASLGQMAGSVAHEINNPLTIISSSIRTLEKAISKGTLTNELVTDNMKSMTATIGRISKIILGLRVISRESSGEDHKLVLLRDIFDDVLSLSSEKFKNHGISLEMDSRAPALDKKINCSRVQLSQVLLNLLSNAHDAIEHLENKWVRLNIAEEGTFMIIRMTDSGHGIPEEIQNKMFNPFFTSKEIGKGTGLGLSISRKIIEQHQGKLEIDTQTKNTCFVIKLPRP